MSVRASGRWTLMTTRSPVASPARCTWPIVPAASGDGSIVSKTSSHGTPRSCSMTRTTSDSDSGATRSRSCESSSMNSGGKRSGRVDRICPSFANVGPSSSSAARNRCACRRRASDPPSSPMGRSNSSRTPCFASTAAIVAPRANPPPACVPFDSAALPAPRAAPLPSAEPVLTMMTVHRALWLMRFGTLPRRNCRRPAMPAFPTTRTSAASSLAARTIAIAGSSSNTTFPRARCPAIDRACVIRSPVSDARSGRGDSGGLSARGMMTWTTCSSASNRSANPAAQRTACSADSERSVPTMTRRGI